MLSQRKSLPILALITASVLWGANTFLIKISLESIPIPIFIAVRFVIAALIILPFALRVWKPLSRKDLWLVALSSLLYVTLSVTVLNVALTKTTASSASVIWLLMPVILFFLSLAFLKERLSWRTATGIAVALAGSLLIIGLPDDSTTSDMLVGNILVVGAVILNAISIIICKPLSKKINSYQLTFLNFIIGVAPIAIYATTQVSSWDVAATTDRSWIAMVLSILFVVIANLSFFYALRYKTVQSTGTYQYIDPIVTVMGAYVFLAEKPTSLFFVGAALIVAGVYVVESSTSLLRRRKVTTY